MRVSRVTRVVALLAVVVVVAVGCIPGDGQWRRFGKGEQIPLGLLLVKEVGADMTPDLEAPHACRVEYTTDEGEFLGRVDFSGSVLLNLTPTFTKVRIVQLGGRGCVGELIPPDRNEIAAFYSEPFGTFTNTGRALKWECQWPDFYPSGAEFGPYGWVKNTRGTWAADCAALGLG